MKILVTRPEREARGLAEALAAKGHDPLSAPLITIEDRPAAIDFAGVQAVLLTSANGARALSKSIGAGSTAAKSPERKSPERKSPGTKSAGTKSAATQPPEFRHPAIFAVGPATEAAAKEEGVEAVETAGGDAEALADLVIDRLTPDGGAILHIAGTHVAGRVGERLRAAGFDYRRLVLYEAVACDRLPEPARTALANGRLEAAVFFSPRTARLFAERVAAEGLEKKCRGLICYALSPAVAEAADVLDWRAVAVAPRPDQAALLELIPPAGSDKL